MTIYNARLLAGVLLLCLVGCASTPQTRAVLDIQKSSLPRHILLDEVPFFAQEDYQCGPAALAMSLSAAGLSVTPEALTPQVYLPDRQGSLQAEMLGATRRRGAVAYQLEPALTNVLIEVADGTPVIVLQNLGLSWFAVWHYAVVVGYDLDQAKIMLRSGRDRLQLLPMTTFEHTWARSGYWAMVTLPPGRIPATANEMSFVSAVSAFERIGDPEHARISYLAALERWPGNLTAQIGVGNTAYKLKQLGEAEKAFRQAVQDHPGSVAALNNLAQTLADQQRYEEALPIARRAVSLGGALAETAKETLKMIEDKARP
jgi:tetratricopeptide (TPR) repeat protein